MFAEEQVGLTVVVRIPAMSDSVTPGLPAGVMYHQCVNVCVNWRMTECVQAIYFFQQRDAKIEGVV